jgi:hypothetical protein
VRAARPSTSSTAGHANYKLRGVMICGLCGRRMSGKWNNDQAYYLCRYPTEYALANRITHPKNVYLREADVLGRVEVPRGFRTVHPLGWTSGKVK